MKFLKGLEPYAFAALRIVSGFLFLCHGAQKLFGAFGGHAVLHVPLMLAAGIIEFGCGTLILLGLFTRVAAFIASGHMAFAYFMAHAGWVRGSFPSSIRASWRLFIALCFSTSPVTAPENSAWTEVDP
jgi:putative oxidoreductase